MISTKELAAKIRKLGKEKSMSGAQVLKACEINRNFLYDLEHADTSPSIDKIERLANFFGISIDYLLGTDCYSKSINESTAQFLTYFDQLNAEEKKDVMFLVKSAIFNTEAEKDFKKIDDDYYGDYENSRSGKSRILNSRIPRTWLSSNNKLNYATAPTLDEAIILATKMRK